MKTVKEKLQSHFIISFSSRSTKTPQIKFILFKFLLVLSIGLLCTNSSWAHLTSDYSFSLGFSSIDIVVADEISQTLESPTTFEFNYNLSMTGADLGLTLSFLEIFSSDIGDIPLTRLAIGPKWYPFGINGKRIVFDSD
jgi:hypothetical protein